MKEKTAKQKANEKYRLKNKEYYANYYKEYRKNHKQKDYYGLCRKKIKLAKEYLKQHSNDFTECLNVEDVEELYNLLDGSDIDEQ